MAVDRLVCATLAAVVLLASGCGAQDCSTFDSCSDCIMLNPLCGWCDNLDFFKSYVNSSSDLGRARLCGSVSELETAGCPSGNIVKPSSSVLTEDSTDANAQVAPASATIELRPGDPVTLPVRISPQALISLDMYVLIDLSFSMGPYLEALRLFSGDLIAQMTALTNKFNIGFGSFVDKTVAPFIDIFNKDFPCVSETGGTSVTPATCDSAYSFQHRLSFTNDTTAFQNAVNGALLSSSIDTPEALFDAIFQIAVCEGELGWSPRGEARRVLLALTDAEYHFALDGKIGGIIDQPMKECHLDSAGKYDFDTRWDYPSTTLLQDLLIEREINLIFAVDGGVADLYRDLRQTFAASSVGLLQENPTALLNIIRNQYLALAATVVPVITGLEDIPEITAMLTVVDCGVDGMLDGSFTCLNVKSPSFSSYNVVFEASPSACPTYNGKVVPVRVQVVGFGFVAVNVTVRCDCNGLCSPAPPMVEAEVICNGGTLDCSNCKDCPAGFSGADCSCPVSVSTTKSCKPSLLASDCSNRGRCFCGVCDCIEPFTGEFCQFDPTDCPSGPNGLPCSGCGECVDGECQCTAGECEGLDCSCSTNTSSCMREKDALRGTVCSGAGQCLCGRCICTDAMRRTGAFCENCEPCRTSCSILRACVECRVTLGGVCSETCDAIMLLDKREDVPNFEIIDFKRCDIREGQCVFSYYVDTLVLGNEPQIHVVLDRNQSGVTTLSTNPGSCTSSALIWPIPVGIVLGIILVGIIAIVLWRCCTYFGEYLEYQNWVKSMENEAERAGVNPLFVDPNARYQNPRYRQGSTQQPKAPRYAPIADAP